jgi:hypothetical protein
MWITTEQFRNSLNIMILLFSILSLDLLFFLFFLFFFHFSWHQHIFRPIRSISTSGRKWSSYHPTPCFGLVGRGMPCSLTHPDRGSPYHTHTLHSFTLLTLSLYYKDLSNAQEISISFWKPSNECCRV